MRISDWSSDVCSSDLDDVDARDDDLAVLRQALRHFAGLALVLAGQDDNRVALLDLCHRSEEHTSELQSLMRISYAVFCLKKKIRIQLNITQILQITLYIPTKNTLTHKHTPHNDYDSSKH